MTLGAWLFLVVVVGTVAVLWYRRHPAILDSGNTDEIDKHSKWHFIGAALTVLVGYLVFRAPLEAAVIISLLGWVLVEVAQRYPRSRSSLTRERGLFSWFDVVFDLFGVALGAVVAHWAGGVVWGS